MSSLQVALGLALNMTVDTSMKNTQKPLRELDPWHPSAKWMAFVKNPLQAPTTCRYCESEVKIAHHKEIYGRAYGEWPWAYLCTNPACRAYVGMHPKTNIPMGTLANAQLREARKEAKEFFNPIWQETTMTRTQAYQWLADALNIQNVNECHIGWFDIDMCRRVVAVCSPKMEEMATDWLKKQQEDNNFQ